MSQIFFKEKNKKIKKIANFFFAYSKKREVAV